MGGLRPKVMRKRSAITASALGLSLGLVSGPVLAKSADRGNDAQFGTRAQASDGRSSVSHERRKSGYQWPELVHGGNAVSLALPLQVPVSSTYEPRIRLGLNYEHQLNRRHWVGGGAALLLDRGNWQTFRMDSCGKVAGGPVCDRGQVTGFDVSAHYNYRIYLRKTPWLVPNLKVGVGGGAWGYPQVNGIRLQDRSRSFSLSMRPGAGFRVFPLVNLGIGAEVSGQVGFVRHRSASAEQAASEAEGSGMVNEAAQARDTDFLFGFEILPLVVEGRF